MVGDVISTTRLTEMLNDWVEDAERVPPDMVGFVSHMLSGFQFPRVEKAGVLQLARREDLPMVPAHWIEPDLETLLDKLLALEAEWRLDEDMAWQAYFPPVSGPPEHFNCRSEVDDEE